MRRGVVALVACVSVALAASVLPADSAPGGAARTQSSTVLPPRALLDQYCVGCHNRKLKTAGLVLETMDVEDVRAGADVWEKVVRKLRAGVMPPLGMPRLDKAAQDGFVAYLESSLDRAAAAAPNPGRPVVHRLNRVEYKNAVRDLLALDVDVQALLPADTSGYGFDNIGDVLSASPGLLERYLSAANKISRLAVGDPAFRQPVETFTLPYLTLRQDERMSDDLPAGSRGGAAIRHYFPLDGEYLIKIRVQRNALTSGGRIRGLDEANEIDLRLDGARLKVFTLGGGPSGRGSAPGVSSNVARFDSSGEPDDGMEVRVPVKAGTRVIGISFLQKTWAPEGVTPSRLPAGSFGFSSGTESSARDGRIEMGVDTVQIMGPLDAKTPEDTPSRRQIFSCRPASGPDEERCARIILSALARRAYRRPVGAPDLQTLVGFYKAGRSAGSFDTGIQRALAYVLTAPDFLFRAERDPARAAPGTMYRISEFELASRLSFFLWSSIPDDELLDVAARGRLKEPAVLESQVRRMLGDPKVGALLKNFFGQWLYLRNMDAKRPDPKAFPDFDENLREAFERETELFLDSQLREDRSITELLTANYTFINERLAKHYGIPNVYGSHFRRVTYGDETRAGILGQGSLLTVTSYANRTSPVFRGKWLLENLLGTPPPPPPANVPPFPENKGGEQPKSVRELMEQHRKNPVCASCHAKLDPLGFALENFDAIGKYRQTDAGLPIDASGTLPDGTVFHGPAEFRKALLSHREEFISTVTQKLLTYALGRGVEPYDMPAVRKIVRASSADDYRWSSLILHIVESLPFQMRRSES